MWFDAQEVGQALEELSKAGCQAIFERPGLSRNSDQNESKYVKYV